MKIKSIKKFIFSVFSILFIIVALTSCGDFNSPSSDDQGSISHDGTNMTLEFPVPRFLAGSSAIDSLQALATIDEGTPHALDVDPNTNQISGTISGVPAGTHNLAITYFVYISDVEVVLCRYSTEVTVITGQTTQVTILSTDLDRNIDNDNDGYTNLAEIRIGTDPLNDGSVPAGESPFVVCGNGTNNVVTSTNYSLTVVVGSALAGTASSTNYRVTIPYSGYKSPES